MLGRVMGESMMGATAAPAVATAWTTADWAFVVSLFSAAISLFSLGWNIWSKWVHPKPRLKVGFAVMHIIDGNGKSPPFLEINATNFGPTDTTLKNVEVRGRAKGWWFKFGEYRWTRGILITTSNYQEAIAGVGPFQANLPVKLPVGEKFSTYLTFKHEHLRDDGDVDIGFGDIFGRYHWAPRKSLRTVVKSIKEKWPSEAGAKGE